MYQESVDCGFHIFKMLDSQKLHLRAAHIFTNNDRVQHRPLCSITFTNYELNVKTYYVCNVQS